jgi:hypothetical protein
MKNIIVASLAIALAGCGPSEEEIRAQKEAEQKLEAEQKIAAELKLYRLEAVKEIEKFSFTINSDKGFHFDKNIGGGALFLIVDWWTKDAQVVDFGSYRNYQLNFDSIRIDFIDKEIKDIIVDFEDGNPFGNLDFGTADTADADGILSGDAVYDLAEFIFFPREDRDILVKKFGDNGSGRTFIPNDAYKAQIIVREVCGDENFPFTAEHYESLRSYFSDIQNCHDLSENIVLDLN